MGLVKAPSRLSVEEVEEAALEALFQKGLQHRLYLAPFVFLGAMSVLAWDPAQWRLWLVVSALVLTLARLGVEFVRVRRAGFHRTRLSSLVPFPATLFLLVVTASGGVDSPVFVMLPIVTVFLCLFLRPAYGFVFACVSSVWVWVLAVVAWKEWVPTFIPLVFGGGPRIEGPMAVLFTRATFHTIALLWASLLGWVMRRAFQSAIQRALDAREELRISHDESTKALTTLVAEIAHELKNPLASVKGLAALVDRDAAGKGKERLTVLRREVDRMQDILESFLNFSRPLVPLEVAVLSLSELTQQVVALYEGVARERGISVRLEAESVTVKADARKMKQVLINLVQNGLDVTAQGETLELRVRRTDGKALVEVMDRGPGVEDVERAFEPGVTSKPHGNGLGLTIARLLARQHGGDVRLVPRDGGGTVAELTLPMESTP